MSSLREKRAVYARQLVEDERYEKAVSLYNRMVADDPADIGALRNLGDLHLRLGHYHQALSAYERIAEHHYRQVNFPESAAVYEQIWMIIARHAPELRPSYAHITGRLVQVLSGMADTDYGLRMAARLLVEHHEAEIARWAAAKHLEHGTRLNAAAALALLRKCFADGAVDVLATSLVVRAFDQMGQPEKGTVVLRETARMAWRSGDHALYGALVDALAVRSPEDTLIDMDARRELLRSEITAVDFDDESVTNVEVTVFEGSHVGEMPASEAAPLSADETPLPLLKRVDTPVPPRPFDDRED